MYSTCTLLQPDHLYTQCTGTSNRNHPSSHPPQAHKFVVGLAPINSLCRVGSAVANLVAVPAAQISAASAASRGGSRGGSRGSASGKEARLSQQLRRSSSSFVRALMFEALGLGATVAAGAQMVLQVGCAAAAAVRCCGVRCGGMCCAVGASCHACC